MDGAAVSADRTILRLPAVYTLDWMDRCNGQKFNDALGTTQVEVLSRHGDREVTIAVNAAGYADLCSDLDYYCDPGIAREMWSDNRGIIMSARATRARIADNADG